MDLQSLIIPSPAIKRHQGLLVAGHRVNWRSVGQTHGKVRFRIRAFFPDHDGYKLSDRHFFRHFIDDPEDAEDFWRRLKNGMWPSWLPSCEDYPGLVYEFATNVILTTTGVANFTVPPDWNNSMNNIQGIGEGDSGLSSSKGGGGGAYSSISNLTLTIGASIPYQIGSGNSSTPTQFLNSSTMIAAGSSNGNGGDAGSSVGTTKFSGGAGSPGAERGAGGAAGPSGAGVTGGTTIGGNGGAGGGGLGGAGGIGNSGGPGGAGGNGAEFDGSHGSGGGGGGGSSGGGAGGLYGGGGGGSTGAGGSAAQGIIFIRYTPTQPFPFLAPFSLPIIRFQMTPY